MGDLTEATPATSSSLRRRNSISTSVVVPSKLSLPTKPHHHTSSLPHTTTTSTTTSSSLSSSSSSSSQSFPTVDFELISIKPLSYISLRDLLPSTCVQSPTASTATGGSVQSSYEISIRNRLVKQAACAYLQPMSTSPDSAGRCFLHRLWISFSDFFRFIDRHIFRAITRAFDWFLRSIRVQSSR